jgi:glycosyltransferase involved in cell wall biosynthesis
MTTGRGRVAVVTWSVNHNPIGRAHVLAELLSHSFDVELVGFEFPSYGTGIWPPLRESRIPIRSYFGAAFPQQLDLMQAVGRTLDVDAVLVSKPRLPGLAVGAFAKEEFGRALVVDVDDWELSFVGASEGVDVGAVDEIRFDDTVLTPYGRVWTQVCDTLVGEADGVTVSNVSLQKRFGGTVVPHARDELLFDPARYDRATVRARLGIDPDVRLVLFGGTPRRHKGIVQLAEAIAELGDPSVALGVIATNELTELRGDLQRIGCRLVTIPPQPFADMPVLLAAADVTAVLQDPNSPISMHQMPAKVTDALAMQVPCVVNAVPPLQSLIDEGCLELVGPDGLTAALGRVLDDEGSRRRAVANREVFLDRYSHAAVAPVLNRLMWSAIDEARPLSGGLRKLLDVQRSLFPGTSQAGTVQAAATAHAGYSGRPANNDLEKDRKVPARSAPISERRRSHPGRGGGPCDLVVFWKQNDSGIYGRRSDMLVGEVARSHRIARTIHFDAPLGIEALRRIGQSGGIDHHQLIFETTIRRVLGQDNEDTFTRHTFLYDDRGDRFDLPRRDQFGKFVEEVLAAHGVGQRDMILWAYPTNPDLPAMIDRLNPTMVVADVVDDNRTWYPVGSNDYQSLTDNYREVLARADVVLANCAAVRDAMSEFHDSVELLPNACEPPEIDQSINADGVPCELARLGGPIIGYVGNLSARIDVDLLDHVARSQPTWNIVLIGSTHAGQDALQLARHPNVLFLGPRRHVDAKRYIAAFDVAIIPHLDNVMTRSMNPLKTFVYCSLGVPVVSTELANLDELKDLITVATDRAGFVAGIEQALARGRRPLDDSQLAILHANSWAVRARRVLDLIDAGPATVEGRVCA